MEGGDELTIVEPSQDNMLIQDERFIDNIQMSPAHANTREPGAFPENDDLPPNAMFFRKEQPESQQQQPKQMISSDADWAQLKIVAGQLCVDWGGKGFVAPAIARRIRDFQFAQEKRRKKFGVERPWGILGLYDHLSAVRMDVEWAEIAACRRANGEP